MRMPTSRITPLLLLLLCVSISCKKAANVNPDKGTGKPLVLDATQQQESAAGNSFNFNLFKTVAATNTTNGNLFMSPLSVGFALGMTSNGSNGQTLDNIKKAMNLSGFTQDQINSYYQKLLTDLPALDPNTTLKIANSVWYRQDFSVLLAFLQANTTYYNAKVEGLDFNNPAAVTTINNWVSAQTNGKIPTIIDQISPDMVMYLINAIYFKSTWKEKFDVASTTDGNFTRADKSVVKAHFMTGTVDYKYYDTGSATIVELPYSNDRFSLVVVMPYGTNTVQSTVANLNAAQWQTWMGSLQAAKNFLELPKFNFTYSIKLNDALSSLGMTDAFAQGADFSKISTGGKLYINSVAHKAYINVDETGTEAAAVTSVGIQATAVRATIINQPFLFAIREMNTGLILFTGVVNDPTM